MNAVYRVIALRICGAFKTTSNEAALVEAGMILGDILTKEMNVNTGM